MAFMSLYWEIQSKGKEESPRRRALQDNEEKLYELKPLPFESEAHIPPLGPDISCSLDTLKSYMEGKMNKQP